MDTTAAIGAHTPTPWKVVSYPHFDNGNIYTSIQPVTVDEETMKPLAMANGEYHICRMSHTAAPWRFEYHRANAAFIVRAVNAYDTHRELIATLCRALELAKDHSELEDEVLDLVDDALSLARATLSEKGDE